MQSGIRFDDRLLAIGLGVAGQIEKYCNRKFMYQVGCTDTFGADRVQFLLSHFPVVAPITMVEFKFDEQTGWVTQVQGQPNNLTIRSLDAKAGIINFHDFRDCGPWWAEMRFTYNGGFWWQTLEKSDPAYNPAVPAGIPCLPEEIRLAWLTQSRKVWEAIDKVGNKILEVGSNTRQPSEALAGLDLVPLVKEMLAGYVRYQMV